MKKWYITVNTSVGILRYEYNAPNKECAINNAKMKTKSIYPICTIYAAFAAEIR